MAKDAGGHGSEARGGSMGRPEQGAKFQARQSMKAANSPDSWEARYGTKMDRDRLRADAINQGVNVGFKSSLKDAGLTDKAAAASLASGPKSAPVDTHPAMSNTVRDQFIRSKGPAYAEAHAAAAAKRNFNTGFWRSRGEK